MLFFDILKISYLKSDCLKLMWDLKKLSDVLCMSSSPLFAQNNLTQNEYINLRNFEIIAM